MKLYLVKDADDATPLKLCPTKKEATTRAKDFNRAVEIEPIEVEPNAKSICSFISRYFGVAIFEN